jgi:hypothetical protein
MRGHANEGEMRQSCVCQINEANSKLIRIQTQPKIVWRYLVGISWDTIIVLFKKKYLNFNWQSSKVMMESELFLYITLQPGQNIEDYFSSIVDKGQLPQKPEHE